MRRIYRTLNDCEMQHNAEVGLFTRPSDLIRSSFCKEWLKAEKFYILYFILCVENARCPPLFLKNYSHKFFDLLWNLQSKTCVFW